MRTQIRARFIISMVGLALLYANVAQADIPLMVNHQGLLKVNGFPFEGTGLFKFGFVSDTDTWLWTNDGSHISSPVANVPTTQVAIPVVKGVYYIRLGDTSVTGMSEPLTSDVFAGDNVKLRIMFNDGVNGWEVLADDQRLASTPYAYHASTADTATTADSATTATTADSATTAGSADAWGQSGTVLFSYRSNCMVLPVDASSIKVLAGEVAIPNAAGTDVRFRRNTAETTVTWGDLDTGSEANDTQYYVYALGDTGGTTFTVAVSASDSAPNGATYYRRIGYFYNDPGGDIIDVGNIKGGDVPNILKGIGRTDIYVPTSMAPLEDMEVRLVSSGRPVRITFTAPFYSHYGDSRFYIAVNIDGSNEALHRVCPTPSSTHGHTSHMCSLSFVGFLTPGPHTIGIWADHFGTHTLYQYGLNDDSTCSEGPRVLIVEEL